MAARWVPVASAPQPALPIREKAGDGNRTHVACLEGRYSTIELHPHSVSILIPASHGTSEPEGRPAARTRSRPPARHPDRAPIRSMPGAGDMGGAGFEPAKAVPPDLQSGP